MWAFGVFISCPFFLMVEFTESPAQCELSIMKKTYLIYLIVLNAILIFVPMVGLFLLYIWMIIIMRKKYILLFFSKLENELEIQNSKIEKSTFNKSSIREIKNKESKFSSIKIRTFNQEENSVSSSKINSKRESYANSLLFSHIDEKTHFSIKNKIKTIINISFVTLAFFSCQLPIRVFLLWSYLHNYFTSIEPEFITEERFNLINIISYLSTFIYFLHCISNPIIYNISSTKFRKAFFNSSLFRNIKN
jgi:hypothetical protein